MKSGKSSHMCVSSNAVSGIVCTRDTPAPRNGKNISIVFEGKGRYAKILLDGTSACTGLRRGWTTHICRIVEFMHHQIVGEHG